MLTSFEIDLPKEPRQHNTAIPGALSHLAAVRPQQDFGS